MSTISLFHRSCSQAYSVMMLVPCIALSLIWRMVSGLPRFHGQYIDFVPRSYEEEVREKGIEPRSRSLRLVYKEVDRPLYEPRDSENLEQELRNLILLCGVDGVVQLVAVVISRNPYQTMDINNNGLQTVLRGILLEYHSNGKLQRFLQSPKEYLPWHQWAIQITSALSRLHELGITHMDLKPANIVITSISMTAILIDVSGTGGTSQDWLSPETKTLSEPLSEDLNSRIQNDIWAVGKIVSPMGKVASDKTAQRVLTRLSQLATTELPPRISLQDVLSLLSQT